MSILERSTDLRDQVQDTSGRKDHLHKRRAVVALYTLCLSLLLITSVHADEVYEFNHGYEGWEAYPSQLGRSGEPGWSQVSNDGEGALRNSPSRNRSTYYWKLTQDIDLRALDNPSLELKYQFKGYGYDYFRVLVGDLGAQHPSDFAVLHETNEATAEPEEVSINLSAYMGQRVRLQLILRKPNDVVEQRIGVYVHRAAIVTPLVPFDLEDRSEELRISSFNVQAFGLSKTRDLDVLNVLTQVISRFDLVVIQEVRDISETAIAELLAELNAMSPTPYALDLSDRLGRGSSKEQVAFIYRTDKLSFVESGVTPDPEDLFERPPAWARFEHSDTEERLWILSAHIDPRYAPSEIAALYDVFDQYQRETPVSESALIMGDLKAGCGVLSEDEIMLSSLFSSSSLTSLISHEADTTTTSSFCPYDRIFVGGPWAQHVQESGVYRFGRELGLTSEQRRAISDHYPVWVRFHVSGTD